MRGIVKGLILLGILGIGIFIGSRAASIRPSEPEESEAHKRMFTLPVEDPGADVYCTLSYVDCPGERHWQVSEEEFERYGETIMAIVDAANNAGVDPQEAIQIARCESQFDPQAKNPRSTAQGLYQFLAGTWDYIDASGPRTDLNENIAQFMRWYPRHPEWWNECRSYAQGA